jgi:hypothetical protein
MVTRRPCGQAGPTTPPCKHDGLGYVRVRSPLLAESLVCFLFLWVLRWFTSPRCLPLAYGFSQGYPGMSQGGFPHSEIVGSKPVCGSPTLIAAYHVLHRLLAPRHSPYALSSLTIDIDSLRNRNPLNTASLRVLVRNYPLQDIQLSKIRLRPRGLRRDKPKLWRIPGSNR